MSWTRANVCPRCGPRQLLGRGLCKRCLRQAGRDFIVAVLAALVSFPFLRLELGSERAL